MSEQKKPRIVIIGGGLGGLTLALGIAKIGKYDVTVVEKRKKFIRQGSAFGLAPNGIKALEELGLEGIVDEMRQVGLEHQGVQYPVKPIIMLWWILRDALLTRILTDDSAITLYQGLELNDIRDDQNVSAAQVSFSNSDLVLEGEMIVGADGVHSQVRDLIGLPPADCTGKMSYRGHIDISIHATADMPKEDKERLTNMLEKGIVPVTILANNCAMQVFSFHPKMRQLAWVLNVPMEMIPQIKSPEDAFGVAFQRHLTGASDETSRQNWESVQLVKKYTNPNHIWCSAMRTHDLSDNGLEQIQAVGAVANDSQGGWGGRGRVTLIGDAAHSMRPTSGQGGSMAMEDAVALCRILARDDTVGKMIGGGDKDKSSYHSCEEHVVKEFEIERLPRVQVIHQDQEMRANLAYRTNKLAGPWSPDFENMVYGGI
jgi:2-polyprenyl-6-methoxyphenol hydroxylase-like FAD-dependent oxidoreductase